MAYDKLINQALDALDRIRDDDVPKVDYLITLLSDDSRTDSDQAFSAETLRRIIRPRGDYNFSF